MDGQEEKCDKDSLRWSSETDVVVKPKPWRRSNYQVISVMLPHVNLVVMMFAYILIGGALFYAIEGPNEPVQRDLELRTIFDLRDEFDDLMWNITQDTKNLISREALRSIQKEYFNKLAQEILISSKNQLIHENHLTNSKEGAGPLWTYSNSVLYATTVITTMGYGKLVPTTTLGNIATIIYALVGIPILFITIADIATFIQSLFNYLYNRFRTFVIELWKSRRHPEENREDSNKDDVEWSHIHGEVLTPISLVMFILLTYVAGGGFLLQSWQGSEYFEAFFSCFKVLTTIGYSNNLPTTPMHTFFTIAYIMFGLCLAYVYVDVFATKYIRELHFLFRSMVRTICDMIEYLERSLTKLRELNPLDNEQSIEQEKKPITTA